MSPLSPAAAVPPPSLETAPAVRLDVEQVPLDSAGARGPGQPDAIGQNLLGGLDGFSAQESQFRAALDQAVRSDPARPAASSASPASLTEGDMLRQGEAMQQHSLGVMMQTYSFALEATLVTNAATTFTSSINTLIKTQ